MNECAYVGTEVPVTESDMWYECCETPWSRVTFTLRLRRKPLYYIINLIMPCCLFSILTAITFLLQPGCSDRLGLGQCATRYHTIRMRCVIT